MNSLTRFIRNITTHCHNIPDDYVSCMLKSPNVSDNVVKCSVWHPERSCWEQSMFMLLKTFNSSYKSFLIANLFPVIMYKRRELRTNPKKVLYRLFISLLRSFTFVASIGNLYGFTWCTVNKMRFDGTKSAFYHILVMICCNVGIFAETSSRIEETFLYLLVSFLQMAWNYLKKKFHLRTVPMFTNFLFALSVGLFVLAYAKDGGNMKDKYYSMCEQVVSLDKKPDENTVDPSLRSIGLKENMDELSSRSLHNTEKMNEFTPNLNQERENLNVFSQRSMGFNEETARTTEGPPELEESFIAGSQKLIERLSYRIIQNKF